MLQLHTDYTNSSTLTTTSVYLLNMWGTFTTICGRITYVYVHLIINSHQVEYNVPVISWERPWIIGSCFLLSSLASCTELHSTQDMILRHVSIAISASYELLPVLEIRKYINLDKEVAAFSNGTNIMTRQEMFLSKIHCPSVLRPTPWFATGSNFKEASEAFAKIDTR